MKEVTYIGEEEYHGHDAANDDRKVDLFPGDTAKVSDEKAAQLERDFPDWFLIDGNPCEGAGQTAPPVDAEDDDEFVEPEFGSDEYWARWDELSEEDVLAKIAAWAADDIVHPDAETIEQLVDHEEQHGNRPAVVAALDEALAATQAK